MTYRIQNIVHILFIFYFTELFSVQATTSSPLPNEVKSTAELSSDAESATFAPSRPVASTVLTTETVNTVLEHKINSTAFTSTTVTGFSSSTMLSHLTTNTTNNKQIPNSDATEPTPSATVYHTLDISSTQGDHENATELGVTTLTSTEEYPPTQSNSSAVTEQNTMSFDAVPTSQMSGNEIRLKNSEALLTIAFSIILGIAVVALIIYSLNKFKQRRSQYSHHPLHDTSYESADRYFAPDDTLVISGGLYDAPRVYNPNMTVLEDEECQHDYISFGSKPGQFRLEFLPGEKEKEPSYESSSSETFHSLQKNC